MREIVNSGPYGPPPDAPPPPPPGPPQEAGTPPAYPSGYPAAPTGAPLPPPTRPRNLVPLFAIIVTILVVLGGVGGYVVGGFAMSQSQMNKAQDAYNTVVGHQNSLNDAVTSLNSQLTSGGASSSTVSAIQQDKSLLDQVISKSTAAQPQIASDDASLTTADTGLHENSWLTTLSRSKLDRESSRLQHARAALALAKTITADYVQIGTFYQSLFDTTIDLVNLGTKAQASDFVGAAAANETLKSDVAKAIQLDKAPGIPPDMDALLLDIQTFAGDTGTLFNAIASGDSATAQTSGKAVEADSAKLQTYDFTKMGNEVDGFYNPLIDKYNSEVDQANKLSPS